MPDSFTRRRVLQTASALVGSAALLRPSWAAKSAAEWDLIVVGGGNAGLPTAIFAAQRGARVLIVEAAGQVGGTLFLSSGQMSAAGTKLQRARGISEDTPDSHYNDVMRISGNTADPVLLRLAVDNAARGFDWLTDQGFKVHDKHPVTGTTHDPYSYARYAWGLEGGMSILKVLQENLKPAIESGRISVRTQSEAVDLVRTRSGAVTGVVVRGADGRTETVHARAVALTTGGYTANPKMYRELEGAPTYTRATYPFSQGAGITLGVAAGGYVRGRNLHIPLFGAITADNEYPSPIRALARHFPGDRPPFEIFVNVAGKRFFPEDLPNHTKTELALAAQPEERCWVVYDEAIRRAAPQLVRGGFSSPWSAEEFMEAFTSGTPMFFKADSLAALARAAGVDAAGLDATVTAYNTAQRSGSDPLGRKHMPLPIAEPPFYAIQLQSWNLTSVAGLAVDQRLRVVRENGGPIPGLFAAGELLGMGQLSGRAICGGMSVTPALSLGRLLGKEIVPVGRA